MSQKIRQIRVSEEFYRLLKKKAIDEDKNIIQFTREITNLDEFCERIKPKTIKRNNKGYLDGFL